MNKSMVKKIIRMFLGFVLVTVLDRELMPIRSTNRVHRLWAKTYKKKIGEEIAIIEGPNL